MARAYLITFAVILTSSSAFNQADFYHSFYSTGSTSLYRRVNDDAGSENNGRYQGNSRTSNERSIPYRTDAQRVQQGRIGAPDEAEPRNGNATYKFGNEALKGFPSIASRRGGPRPDDAIVFPGPTSGSIKQKFVPEIPQDCEELGICEEVPNYPYEHVDQLLDKAANLTYFNIDILTPEISQRQGPHNKEVLCGSRVEVIYPKAAKNVNGKWVFILNKKQYKVQGFKIEICLKPDKPCNPIAYVEEKYKLECGQKTTQRAMWSLNEEGFIVMEVVETPSCCTCVLKDNMTSK